ncbi:MAG: CerR family C-terminal domain-containing protein [Gammaproteobacteria bacterium]|nr:CerR family C-terminal domain-containing protein [Gammaproteobacteria bacterium]
MQPRENILFTALKLFAAQGLARTTVRQIAKEAAVNVSAISYYFGDKNGLYRAAFTEAMPCPVEDIKTVNHPSPSLEQTLNILFNGFIEPLKQSELVRLCMRLHMRELIEPTGLWSEMISNDIAPRRQALLLALQKHLNLSEVDDDLHRLAMSIVAMGVHLLVGRDVIESVCPQIIDTEQGLDDTHAALVRFATSMVEAEAARRKAMPA